MSRFPALRFLLPGGTDDAWMPPSFSSVGSGTLTPFGTLVKDWLSAKYASDWVQ